MWCRIVSAVDVGDNLRLLIEAARSNPSQVAKAIERDPATVIRWLRRPKLRLSPQDEDAIAAFLQIAPEVFRERLRAQKGVLETMLREGKGFGGRLQGFGIGTEESDEDASIQRLESYARRIKEIASETQGRIAELVHQAEEEVRKAKAESRKRRREPSKQ